MSFQSQIFKKVTELDPNNKHRIKKHPIHILVNLFVKFSENMSGYELPQTRGGLAQTIDQLASPYGG